MEEVTEAERANFKAHEALYEQKFARDQNTTVGEFVKTKIAKLGENINISRFVIYRSRTATASSAITSIPAARSASCSKCKRGSAETADKDEFKKLGARYGDAGGGR